ncbi:P-loop ATPase, Sll1717 family [Halomonas sp. M4R1S46]|uniref:P-loop ATPase, Sll1717 family n=1 Tax=Halomonas sp. M4R1S46 TaxID=2982692 RepID=UPI0021E43A95|nr:hypothetical protein [Halomonas sp. M4R1S46]UYG06839.1 hypothetical protein OCT48_14580 [Halomonas sp. M4R1S46]
MSIDKPWKSLRALQEPFNDAFNYRSRKEKELFNKVFLITDSLERCLSPSTYFLMGEKGAGKTAYAVYLENNALDNNKCQVTTMTETQYARFINLKKAGKLEYSDYANTWRSMLLFLVGHLVINKSKGIFSRITGKYNNLEKSIEMWTKNALNPEIESAFEAITSDKFDLELGQKGVAKAGASEALSETEKTPRLKHHLLETEMELKSAISSLKLKDNHVLFVDGIDYRPERVSYREYLECIKGLSEAAWQLNTEFFNGIRDSKGRIKIVLLVRPDVFHALNVYNSNSRLQDNTVYLDWATNEKEYKGSPLFEVSGRYFSRQQTFESSPEDAWNNYYRDQDLGGLVFKKLLRQTFQKPRDILTFIKITREIQISAGKGDWSVFQDGFHANARFTRAFSDYLLGEARNYSAFYMTQEDFRIYLKFFHYLNGKARFSFDEFDEAYNEFHKWAKGEKIRAKEYLHDSESLLQFFYDVNIIGYSEETEDSGEGYYHWSYRERSPNNIAPKVKAANKLMINPGIAKALDIGKAFSQKKAKPQNPRKRKPKNTSNRRYIKSKKSNQ